MSLGAAALFVWLSGFVSRRAALATALGLTLGSLPLPYSTLLFSHAQVIGLLAIAIWAVGLFQEGRISQPEARWQVGVRMAGAGFCLGLALASEYTAGIVVVALVASVVHREWRAGREEETAARGEDSGVGSQASGALPVSDGARTGRRRGGIRGLWAGPLRWMFVAALPPLLLIPAYSWATIGTPWDLPYSYQARFPEMREGLYGIKWPDLEILGRLLVGPTRGLVFWTPFLAGLGWWWIARERPR